MGTIGAKRRGVLARLLGCGCGAGLTGLWLFLIAAVVPAAVWSGVQLERPEPRSGEDERAGRRRAAADHRGAGKRFSGLGVVGGPGIARLAEWSHMHPSGTCQVAGAMTVFSGDRAAQSGHRARPGRLMRFCELTRGLATPPGW